MVKSKRHKVELAVPQENANATSIKAEVDGVQNTIGVVATDTTRATFRMGKKLAQKRYVKKYQRARSMTVPSDADVNVDDVSTADIGKAIDTATPPPDKELTTSRKKPNASNTINTRNYSVDKLSTRPTIKQKTSIQTRPASQMTSRNKNIVKGNTTGKAATTVQTKAKEVAQKKLRQQAIQKSAQNAKLTAKGAERIKEIVIQGTKAVVKMAVGLLGGAGAVVALMLVVAGVASVLMTPFGVFWSGEDGDATDTMPLAVSAINSAFSQKITQIQQDNPSDSVEIHRVPDVGDTLAITNWTDVVAVFAVKTAGASADATDVVVIDDTKIALLTEVFWDMNVVTHRIETIEHPATEDAEGWTETILHITITSKSYGDMGAVYGFNTSQEEALNQLMQAEYAQLFAELIGTYGGELTLTPEELEAMMERLPEDLSPERLAVVETAYSLIGRVQYFWGGKSYAIGWDSRWGTPTTVSAAGSSTTGTVRPLGLDCSGFVDWVFNNAVGYIIGQGGGATAQHGQCTTITWAEATAGDLVFYPGNSHVGIYVGLDENNQPLIIHCASSQNNVVITGLQGFTSIARPNLSGF